MSQQHTPTPWVIQPCGELCPDGVMIVANLGKRDGFQQISTVAKALSIRQTKETTAANAAFIVKAVNSHQAMEDEIISLGLTTQGLEKVNSCLRRLNAQLVKALENARDLIEAELDVLGPDTAGNRLRTINKIDSALALSKGAE